MNMYPKVVNINMNQPQYSHYNPYTQTGPYGVPQNTQHTGINSQRGGYNPQEIGFGGSQNTMLKSQQNVFLNPPAASKQTGAMNNITLDATINL